MKDFEMFKKGTFVIDESAKGFLKTKAEFDFLASIVGYEKVMRKFNVPKDVLIYALSKKQLEFHEN